MSMGLGSEDARATTFRKNLGLDDFIKDAAGGRGVAWWGQSKVDGTFSGPRNRFELNPQDSGTQKPESRAGNHPLVGGTQKRTGVCQDD